MTDLERALAALGAGLDWPETPDLAGRVAARLAEEPEPRRRRVRPSRRALVLVFAALVAAVGVAFAVPPARTAILDWLGFRGVEIRRTPEPPAAPPAPEALTPELGLGGRVTLEEARRRAAYPVPVPGPTLLGPPASVHFSAAIPGGQVSFVWLRDDPERPLTLLSMFRANGTDYVQKSAGSGTRIEPVAVDGGPGYWLEGEPHAFVFRTPDGEVREETFRLAGNVLLWQRGELTLRLEGMATLAEALAVAESVSVR